jgi:hypothetical protein
MQQVTGRRERKNAKVVAIVCAALLVLTYLLSQFNTWSRKPADAGECASNGTEWRDNAIKSKLDTTDAANMKSKSFTVQSGAHWSSEDHLWVVPFRTPEQNAGDKNFVALIHCTGSVDIRDGGQ